MLRWWRERFSGKNGLAGDGGDGRGGEERRVSFHALLGRRGGYGGGLGRDERAWRRTEIRGRRPSFQVSNFAKCVETNKPIRAVVIRI